MKKFRIICPECGVALITALPEALVWELCPVCRRHVWDMYDALMADKLPAAASAAAEAVAATN